MNSYGDEEIVKILNQYKKESRGDVYSGIKINGDLYHFHEYKFWDGQIQMMIPLRFIDMPEEIIKIKYGHIPLPDVIKCSRDYNIDIMMSFTDDLLSDDEIEEKLDDQINLIKTLQPTYEIYEKNIEYNGYVNIGWFDYKASAIG